jgi:D-cysteine desulfhydrase
MLASIVEVARTEGIVLDPVYTGKAFFGLTREQTLGNPAVVGGSAGDVVFLHTGGIFGLLPFAERLRLLL